METKVLTNDAQVTVAEADEVGTVVLFAKADGLAGESLADKDEAPAPFYGAVIAHFAHLVIVTAECIEPALLFASTSCRRTRAWSFCTASKCRSDTGSMYAKRFLQSELQLCGLSAISSALMLSNRVAAGSHRNLTPLIGQEDQIILRAVLQRQACAQPLMSAVDGGRAIEAKSTQESVFYQKHQSGLPQGDAWRSIGTGVAALTRHNLLKSTVCGCLSPASRRLVANKPRGPRREMVTDGARAPREVWPQRYPLLPAQISQGTAMSRRQGRS